MVCMFARCLVAFEIGETSNTSLDVLLVVPWLCYLTNAVHTSIDVAVQVCEVAVLVFLQWQWGWRSGGSRELPTITLLAVTPPHPVALPVSLSSVATVSIQWGPLGPHCCCRRRLKAVSGGGAMVARVLTLPSPPLSPSPSLPRHCLPLSLPPRRPSSLLASGGDHWVPTVVAGVV